ncbi:MAG: hypothetical protein M0C28_27265 [Candidatus Moduliflexus flocculans]|nr:hypothetical protein [Candidatus Moduliflexus flocculans]
MSSGHLALLDGIDRGRDRPEGFSRGRRASWPARARSSTGRPSACPRPCPEPRPLTADMIFDQASVTKPVATATVGHAARRTRPDPPVGPGQHATSRSSATWYGEKGIARRGSAALPSADPHLGLAALHGRQGGGEEAGRALLDRRSRRPDRRDPQGAPGRSGIRLQLPQLHHPGPHRPQGLGADRRPSSPRRTSSSRSGMTRTFYRPPADPDRRLRPDRGRRRPAPPRRRPRPPGPSPGRRLGQRRPVLHGRRPGRLRPDAPRQGRRGTACASSPRSRSSA